MQSSIELKIKSKHYDPPAIRRGAFSSLGYPSLSESLHLLVVEHFFIRGPFFYSFTSLVMFVSLVLAGFSDGSIIAVCKELGAKGLLGSKLGPQPPDGTTDG